jgi:glycosyltransferase involved in cell wall biosynthesis
MHVVILNQTFWPDTAATAQHMWDLARHLDAAGHRVTVVTSIAYYGSAQRHTTPHQRAGKNIRIHRVGQTAFGKKSPLGVLGRMSDFASFYAAAARELARMEPPDVILALTSPPMVGLLAALQKQWRRGKKPKLVYHVMDLYPEAVVVGGMLSRRHPVTKLLHRVTARTLDLSDAVIALGRDMRDLLLDHYPYHAREHRIHVVTPWSDRELLVPLEKHDNPLARELGLADSFNIVYSGNLGVAHDVATIVDAIRSTSADRDLRWVFIGGGKRFDDLKKESVKAGWPHVKFLPFQDQSVLNQSLNLADVHLVSQLPEFTGVVVPSKLFGILAVGKPAIMVGPEDAECTRIIKEHGAGLVVPNGEPQLLVESIRVLRDRPDLRHDMGRRARRAFELHYDAAVCCARIEQILHNVVHPRTSS